MWLNELLYFVPRDLNFLKDLSLSSHNLVGDNINVKEKDFIIQH